jgi:hypothetical protein
LVIFGAPRRSQEGPRRPKRPQKAPQDGPKVVPRACGNTIREQNVEFFKNHAPANENSRFFIETHTQNGTKLVPKLHSK